MKSFAWPSSFPRYQVLFGINALDGLAKANVNLNLDTFAQLDLSLAASAAAKQLSGCTDVKTGLSVNAGADGSFFSLFSKSTSVSLFNKTFTLFTVRQVCLCNNALCAEGFDVEMLRKPSPPRARAVYLHTACSQGHRTRPYLLCRRPCRR